MARLAATIAVDMTAWDERYSDSTGATVGAHDDTHFRADSPTHTFDTFGENFTYADIGIVVPVGGTIHEFDVYTSGALDFSVTNANADVPTVRDYVISADWSGLAAYVFQADDRFHGSCQDDHLLGFDGDDRMKGGDGNDILNGGAGADRLTGGEGNDRFEFASASESASTAFDTITDFDASADTIDVGHAVTVLDTIDDGKLSKNYFDKNMHRDVADHLHANHGVVFTPDEGFYAGRTFLVVDGNGVAGYQGGADYVIEITGYTGTLSVDNFTG